MTLLAHDPNPTAVRAADVRDAAVATALLRADSEGVYLLPAAPELEPKARRHSDAQRLRRIAHVLRLTAERLGAVAGCEDYARQSARDAERLVRLSKALEHDHAPECPLAWECGCEAVLAEAPPRQPEGRNPRMPAPL